MIGELLALIGATLVLLSAIGVVRFTDALARLHALAKASTLGVLLLIAGAAANLHDLNDVTSAVLAGVLHLLASPPASKGCCSTPSTPARPWPASSPPRATAASTARSCSSTPVAPSRCSRMSSRSSEYPEDRDQGSKVKLGVIVDL